MRDLGDPAVREMLIDMRVNARGFFGIVLIDPKIPENVGIVLRTAKAFGCSFVGIVGERYKRARTDVHNAAAHMPVYDGLSDPFAVVPKDATTVALELCHGSEVLPKFVHHPSTVYIFGPEDGNIPDEIARRCNRKVMIPTWNCLNLASAATVAIYDRISKEMSTL